MQHEQIGNFKLISTLGQGGMGEVWLGEHDKIGTRVAIKMLLPHISANKEHVERFFNEAIAVSKIQHSGIVKIFDVGFHNGRAYLVMEFLKGESLAARIRRLGRMPLAMISEIGRQMAGVLDAVHKAGVTHRDLKPDNIYLVPDDELDSGERVKVLDFGIAKLSGAGGGLTATAGGSMGTPAYMSPEQWKNSKHVDWRADAYSLGCLVFEMAAGQPPFPAESIGEACTKHLTEEPPVLGSLVATPPALSQLVAQLLSKDPEARPTTMREVGQRFAGLVAAANPIALDSTQFSGSLLPVAASGALPAASGPLPAASGGSFAASNALPATSGPLPVTQATAVPPPPRMPVLTPVTTLGGAAASHQVSSEPKSKAMLWGLLGAGAALLVVVVVLAVALGGDKKSDPETVAATTPEKSDKPPETKPSDPPPAVPRGSAATTAGSAKVEVVAKSEVPANKPVAAADKPVVADKPADKPVADKPANKPADKPVAKPATADKPVVAKDDKPAPPKEQPPASTGSCDEVSCVLTNYEGACCSKFKKKGSVGGSSVGGSSIGGEGGLGPSKKPSGLPEAIDRGMIAAGINPVKGRVMACGSKSSAKGTVKVMVKVNSDGSVASVHVKATPDPGLGSCVAAVVRQAHFAFTETGGTFGYPFVF